MISIDYQSKLPLYEQIAQRFQTLILKGALPPGGQMPSVRTLAVELSINPNTIQKAYSLLEQQGYIYPVKGRGNFVSDSSSLVQQERIPCWKMSGGWQRTEKSWGFSGQSLYRSLTGSIGRGIQMIELKNVDKKFQDIHAADHITASVRDGLIFGLVGSNGAGKSTLLRMICGVVKPDSGEILADGESVFENPAAKSQICFLSDSPYYFANANIGEMRDYYMTIYPAFDRKMFDSLVNKFELDPKRKINSFSKGMKKQVSILLGLCAKTKYLLCDETFDGLDPVVRQAVKSLFAGEIMNRDFTPVISSHNLRELEDICDSVGLLHKGKLLLTQELDHIKSNICKLQCVIPDSHKEQEMLGALRVIRLERSGSLLTLTVRGSRGEVLSLAQDKGALFAETLPLTLEEIFISETEVAGYDIKDFLY